MSDFLTHPSLEVRIRTAISAAWAVFARKAGSGLISVNREASMQLQYAYVLKQLLPLAVQHPGENADLELEPGVKTTGGANNIDLLVHATSSAGKTKIAVEMKCYRKLAASGGNRGAHDIFMKDVYEDLHILEQYVSQGIASRGVALVMNDLKRFVNPTIKSGKCWAYDTSQGHSFKGGHFTVPIGGKSVNITLTRSYAFNWEQFGQFWFCELEGHEVAAA